MKYALISILLLLILVTPAGAQEKPKRPPNIILIVADDLGHRDLSCTGSAYFRTPHLDRLAKNGVRFTQAYAAAPVCSPTRAALMTGIHPARLRLTDWLPGRPDMPRQKLLRPKIVNKLPVELTTLPEALKELGYATAHVGKWHVGGEGSLPTDHGFDVNIGGTHAGSPPGGYFNFKTPTLESKGEYLTDRLAAESVAFIERSRSRPFFLYLAHYAPHIPLQAKEELIKRYTDESKRSDPQYNPVYAAMVHSMDESVGRIVETLERLKLLEDTLVVFTSDNGGLSTEEGPHTPATNNTPLRAGKGHLYEGAIRVPLILHFPARLKPAVDDVPAISQDLYKTILWEAWKTADGRPKPSFAGVPDLYVAGNGVPIGSSIRRRRPLFWHYPHYSNQGGKPSGAVREGDWKLIEFFEDDRVELYNVTEDVSESNDVASAHPEQAEKLLRALRDWRREIDAQMPTVNPEYER